jgi:hypothetical protein
VHANSTPVVAIMPVAWTRVMGAGGMVPTFLAKSAQKQLVAPAAAAHSPAKMAVVSLETVLALEPPSMPTHH